MSDDGVEPMEGWSIVRHRAKDDLGSDADSVEVISEDSDRETDRGTDCDEGKDDKESSVGENKPASTADPDSTTPEPDSPADADGGSSDQSEDPTAQRVFPDPLRDLFQSLNDKLHQIFLGGRASSLSSEELRLRYVIVASAILAFLCSLLVATYLLVSKLHRDMPGGWNDRTSAHVHTLQELDQAISKLHKVLRLENEQHLRDILSNMPGDYLALERMIPGADLLPRQLAANAVPTPDVDDASSHQAVSAETLPDRDNTGRGSFANAGNNRNNMMNPENDGRDDMKPSHFDDPRQLVQNQPKQGPNSQRDTEPQKPDFPDPANPSNSQHEAANTSTRNTTTELPTNNKTGSNQVPPTETLLLSVRQDVISIQRDVYSQIMNSFLEYKIDLYKNLLRAGLDISCPEQSNKRASHKNFMLIRSLQQIIAKSSESNFESWYKFYSYSVFPKIRDVVRKIDSITKGSEGRFESGPQKGKEWADFNDDFFIRAGDPHVEPSVERVAKEGFDWKNLDKKIKSMRNTGKHGRPKNDESDGYVLHEKRRGDVGTQPNFVEIGQDFVHEKDKNDKNNLKGDFRKRKGGEHEHKKRNLRDFDHRQNRRQAGHENFKRSHEYEEQEYDRTGEKQEGHEQDKGNDKSEEQEHGKKGHKHEKHERDEKKDQREYEKSKYGDHDKKREHEGKRGKHGNKRYQEHDYARESNRKYMENDEFKKSDFKSNDAEEGYESQQGKYKQKGDYREDQDGGKYKDKKHRKKVSFSDVGKYMKNAASGLWKTVKGGFKKVTDYGANYVEKCREDWREHGEWSGELLKEMKDVVRVLRLNPSLSGLSEVPKSVSKFLGDGWESLLSRLSDECSRTEENEMGPEGLRPGPEGMKEGTCVDDGVCEKVDADWSKTTSEGYTTDEGYESDRKPPKTAYTDAPNHRGTEPAGQKTGSWYYDAGKHRAEARRHPDYPRASDSSWFLGLGRHRAYLRRRGIHLDDDGSWFISSAKHRARMRQQHMETPQSPYFYSPAQRDNSL